MVILFFTAASIIPFLLVSSSRADDIFECTLTAMTGNVHVYSNVTGAWQTPGTGINLYQHDIIKTGSGSSAEITINGEGIIVLEEETKLMIKDLKTSSALVAIESGILIFSIAQLLKPGQIFSMRTPVSVAGIRGTEGVIEVLPDTTYMGLFNGTMEIAGLTENGLRMPQSVLLSAGQQTHINPHIPPVSPYPLKKRLIAHQKKTALLRKRLLAVRKQWNQRQKEKTRNLKKSMKRKKIRLKDWDQQPRP